MTSRQLPTDLQTALEIPEALMPPPDNLPPPVTYEGYTQSAWQKLMQLTGCDKLKAYQPKKRKPKNKPETFLELLAPAPGEHQSADSEQRLQRATASGDLQVGAALLAIGAPGEGCVELTGATAAEEANKYWNFDQVVGGIRDPLSGDVQVAVLWEGGKNTWEPITNFDEHDTVPGMHT